MLFHNEITLGSIVGRLELLSTGPITDLAVNVYHGVAGTSLNLDLEANPDLYSEDTLAEHHARFTRFLGAFLISDTDGPRRIGDLDLLDEDEHRSLVPATGAPDSHPSLCPTSSRVRSAATRTAMPSSHPGTGSPPTP